MPTDPKTCPSHPVSQQSCTGTHTTDTIDTVVGVVAQGLRDRASSKFGVVLFGSKMTNWNVDDWRDCVRVMGIYALDLCGLRGVVVNKDSNGHRTQHVNGTARLEAHTACDFLRERGEPSASVRGGNKGRATLVGGEGSGCQ